METYKETNFKETEIGKIPSDWEVKELITLCEKITDGSHSSPKTTQSGKLIATVKDMLNSGFNYSSCRTISNDDYDKLLKQDCKPKKNDVLIAKDGSYLKHTFVATGDDELVILSSIAIIRPIQDLLFSKYLKYLFVDPITKQRVANNYVSGAVIPRIVLKDFKQIPLPVPPLAEQKAIAKLLSDLDEKIEINKKVNENLEEMGQALFKHWFVDFEFPKSSGLPYKSNGGEMVFNAELQKDVPVGWEIKELKEITNIINGFAFKSKDYVNSGVKIIRTKNFNDIGYVDLKNLTYLTNEKSREYVKFNLQQFDFLLVMVGASIGKSVIVNSNILPGLQNQNMWNFRALDNIAQHYLNISLKKIVANNMGSMSGSARDFFRKDFFYKLNILIPSNGVLVKFNDIIKKIYLQRDCYIAEIQSIQAIRDTLLPKLMRGEIRVKVE
jgi:type I restriction enzyme S subunit